MCFNKVRTQKLSFGKEYQTSKTHQPKIREMKFDALQSPNSAQFGRCLLQNTSKSHSYHLKIWRLL